MGMNSKIEWCDHTFNPVMGCTKVSDGCKFCYAEDLMDKRYSKAKWGPGQTRVRTSAANWKEPYKWNKQAEIEGRRARVFCASLADVFENHIDWVEPRVDLFRMIVHTRSLDWLLLTKRPHNVMRMLDDMGWPSLPDNVWIGTSVENQAAADERIPHLLSIPATVRFLSMEPLLRPVDLRGLGGQFCHKCGEFGFYDQDGITCPHCGQNSSTTHAAISWVIVGGESGRNARPMHLAWARSIRDQCELAGVPFFMKQWGEWAPVAPGSEDPRRAVDFGNGDIVQWVGKKAAGRLLDGVEYNQFPGVVYADR